MFTHNPRIDSAIAVHNARKWLEHGGYCLLDTETTGLGDDAEICEISIIDTRGNILMDSLVKPSRPIPADASRIHGITNEMVSDAPAWPALHPQFMAIMAERQCIVYNTAYDRRIINQTHHLSGMDGSQFPEWLAERMTDDDCAMLGYAAFRGEFDNRRGSYKWQKLVNAARQCQRDNEGAHRALADCRMTLGVIEAMANAKLFPPVRVSLNSDHLATLVTGQEVAIEAAHCEVNILASDDGIEVYRQKINQALDSLH